jgi:hypothetical protein
MEQTATVRVSKSTVIIFAIIFLPLLLWGTSLLWSTGQTEKGVLISIGYVFMVYWVCSPSIELIPGGIIYRALFRRREIDLSTVSEVSVSANPAPSLVFQTAKRGGDLFRFMIKPFSKAGLVAVLHHIRQSNPSIRFDKFAEDMSNADFRSVTREAIVTRNLLRIALVRNELWRWSDKAVAGDSKTLAAGRGSLHRGCAELLAIGRAHGTWEHRSPLSPDRNASWAAWS